MAIEAWDEAVAKVEAEGSGLSWGTAEELPSNVQAVADLTRAMLTLAADQGYRPAQVELMNVYMDGMGTPKVSHNTSSWYNFHTGARQSFLRPLRSHGSARTAETGSARLPRPTAAA